MSADTRLKALREKTSGSNDNFDNRIAALRPTPAATSGNPVDLLPKPEKTRNDNHDVLHSIAPATTASEVKEASVNKAKSDANTIGMINDVIWGDVRDIPSRIGAWSDARKALKSGEIPMDYSGANFNPATDLYVKQQNERAEKERTDKQNEIKAQLEDIDKQIRQSKATAAQYRARTGGLANPAGRAEAQRMVDDANRKTEELQQQRQKLMNELHSVGGKYGVGDFIGDTGEMVFSNAGLQAPDLIDYYLSRGVGLIDPNDKEAYDRAHALQYDRAQQIDEAQSGRGQFGQDYMQAAAAFGDMLSNTAMAYASGVPHALQTYGSAPVNALQNSGIHDLDPSIAGRVISGADKLAGNILADAIAAPTNVAISLSSGVHTFDEAKTKGASTGQAFAAALGSAAAEYFSNKMFSGTPLENNPGEKGYVVEAIESFSKWLGKEEQVKKFFSNKLASFIFDKTGEGWEEVITAVLEPWIAHATYDKDADLATLKELWNEWYIGTFMSVIADTMEPVTNFRAQKAEAREKENEQRRQNAMAQYLAYAAGNANADFHETVSNNYDLLKNANPADIAKAYNVGRNYNRESLQKQSDLETLAAGTMGAEGLKLAAEKRGTMADTDPVAYYNEARQAYDMGRSGGENTFKGEILSTKEANAWYNAGINDAKEETNEQRQSGNESQGRVNGLDSQRQGGRLAEGAGGQLAGEAAEGQRDGGAPVQANDGGYVSRKEAAVKLGQAQVLSSAADKGIANGTAAKTMHYIPEDTMEQWHPDMVEVYNKGKQNGIKVNFYTGRMALDDGNGVFFVRGLNVGDGSVVWIRADADEDIRKIADHEFFHTAEKRDPGLKQRILDKITENKQAKTLQALTQKYADKYDGSGLSDEEILSEICADSYGGIDIFAGITDAKDATEEQKARATDLSETVRGAVMESKPTGAAPENTTTKASREAEENIPPAVQKTLDKREATVIALSNIEDKFNNSQSFKSWRTFATINQIIKYAKENGYSGIVVKNVNDSATPESRRTIAPATDYVFFNPKAQVRSADPVTYDDNGNVIPLSERFNSRQEDIRYSREDDTNRLMQENIDLRQRLDAALADTKQTTAWRANAKDVARVADDVIDATSSKESKAIVAQKIRSLVEAASNGGIDSAEMKDLALDIARGLLKRSSVLTTKDSTTYDGMRDYLKSVYINVPSEMRKEITDWKAFAAAHKAMRMKTAGVAISAVYKEMQKRMGKDYFPDIDSDIEKLRQIAEVLDTLTPVYDNPYSVNMAEATEETANSILESILNIGQAEPTYADRAKARENEVRELYQQKLADQKAYLQQRIQDEADKRKQQTEAVKQHYTEMQENRRLRKQDSEARQKLLRVAKRLQNRKLDAVNRAMVDQLIGDLDTVSVNLTNRSLTNLKELADWYDSYKDDPNFLTDPQVEKKLSRLEKRHIGEMTLDEVRDLTDVLRSIENALATYGKMVRIEDHRLISEMSEQSQENIRNTKGSKKNIADWLVTNTLAPERLIRRLTGYNDSDPLYMRVKELSEGQRKMMDYQMRAEALFSKWTNDKKLIERLRDKDTIKVRAFVDGKETTVEITPDMRMALYLHSLNDQNLKHIMNGGVRIPDIELYRNGDTKEAYSRGVTAKMSPDMVRGIANGMSAEERAFANAAKAYFNGMSRDEINAVSEALLGYSLANVENYFPIQTDDAFTMKEIDAIQNDGSIQGMGFTKERQNASNAIYLVPMTDVLKRSIQNHAKYVGMAIPVANMNRLWMANTKDGETDTTSGLKDTMRSKWGDRANEAVEKILTDVQNPVRKTDDVSKALAKVRSNYAGAVLTLNASVAMKQAASYPTAAAVLGWEPLLKAMKNYGKVDLDLIAKYTPLQWYRSQGFSTQELGDIKSQSGLMDKVLSAHITTKDGREVPLLNWIQGIDLMTTRKLWKASEYYVQQNQKDLKPGTDDYYKAAADIYNRVIEETQPNYTTMQRPQLLRSDNQLLQSLVMFKTQPFQNFNILYDAIGELRAAETMAKNGDPSKLKQARQNAVNAVTSNLVSAVVFAAMTMAWALARRKREKYEDDEGNFSPWGQLGKDILSSELGMIPFGSDAYNLLASMFLGEKYYGMTNITSDSLSGMTESTLNAFNTLKETVTALLDGDDKTQVNPEKIARKLFATAKDASKLLGIPMENVLNLMTAVYSNVASAVNGEYTTAYEVLRLEKGFTSSSSKSTAYDILYKAYQNDRSQYNELRRMMVDDGFKESSIDSAMKKRSSK